MLAQRGVTQAQREVAVYVCEVTGRSPRCVHKAAMTRLAIAAAFALVFSLTACHDYPRDADDMTAQAAGRGMRVGASHDPPWLVVLPDGTVGGPEADLLQRYADAHGYRLIWLPGSHDALMAELERAHLHAVAGGHHADSPWQAKVGWSRPLGLRASPDGPLPERRIALPPGQSAWHLAFDRYVAGRGDAR